MSIDDLNTFIVLYENESFTDAAFELHISQSTLSKKIKGMEHELKVPLISTTNKRSSKITPSGELFYQFAIRSMNAFDKFKDKVEKIYALENGEVKIAYTNDALVPMVINKLNQIMDELPKINLNFKLVTYAQLESIMFKKQADIIFANNLDAMSKEFYFHELCKSQLGIFAYSQIDFNDESTVIISINDQYLSGFEKHKCQSFPSFRLLDNYLKFNPKAVAVLPTLLVDDQIPLIHKMNDSSVKTFLITPNDKDQRPVIKYINENDKRPVIKYIVNKFMNNND